MDKELLKRFLKSCIPWRLRYLVKIQEAKGNVRLSNGIKQQRTIEEYNNTFFNAMDILGIEDFKGKNVCELGPGQHLIHPFLEYQLGASKEILLEIDDFANVNSLVDRKGLKLRKGYALSKKLPKMETNETWKTYLQRINAEYRTDGLDGYKAIPDNSVNYVFSFAVFEHIRKKEFKEYLRQMYRFMQIGGEAFHVVDYTDHLGGKKNHLRFSETVWEDEVHYKLDNYTNRIPCSEMCRIMKQTGFKIVQCKKTYSEKPLIKRKNMDRCFKDMNEEDILTTGAVIIARKE